jgi:hypothetical protein
VERSCSIFINGVFSGSRSPKFIIPLKLNMSMFGIQIGYIISKSKLFTLLVVRSVVSVSAKRCKMLREHVDFLMTYYATCVHSRTVVLQ